jgi:hypothetical protein
MPLADKPENNAGVFTFLGKLNQIKINAKTRNPTSFVQI